jgi:hypothetical protein
VKKAILRAMYWPGKVNRRQKTDKIEAMEE